MNRINRDISTPLYEQLKLIVREQIMMGELTPGSMLPSESAYCEQHQVSRITVSRALSDLEREGFIRRIQGKGSIVIYPRYHDTLKSIKGFSRNMGEVGNITSSIILSADSFIGNISMASLFNLPLEHEHKFMRFQRLRFVNNEPAVIMTNIVLESLGRRLQEYDLETASFYNLYEKILGLPVIRNEAHITPITATPEIVELLRVKPGSPHMLFRGISFLEGDIPVENCVAVFHGSIFQFSTDIYRISEKQSGSPEAQALVFTTG